jgi:hypothetical protein
VGNYTVKNNSPAFQIGFKNIPMQSFGVQKSSLKTRALTPLIPLVTTNESADSKVSILTWLGGMLKNVEGLGERSAYGLPDETGVIIMSIGANSLLQKSGLQEKDVIRMAAGKAIKSIRDLMEMYQEVNWQGHMEVEVLRNQKFLRIRLNLK